MAAPTKPAPSGRPAGAAPSTPSRSPFAAAFLSFLFPGLGQAYAGDPKRGFRIALPPLFGLLILLGVFVRYGTIRFGLWLLQSSVLMTLLILSVALLAYRVFAIWDAYRLAEQPASTRILVRPRPNPTALVGLAAILAVLVGGHAAFVKWDKLFYDFVVSTHRPEQVLGIVSPSGDPSGSAAPAARPTWQPWSGVGRLNVLLVGVDARPADQTFNTDTMIVVSIDPATGRVAMLSLPRDTLGLPTPPGSALAALVGPEFDQKINSLWQTADGRRDLFPGGGADALKEELGYVYGIDIQYYVEVNFTGFRQVVDTLGGVTVNVDAPVVDETYPADDGNHLRIYIAPGIQHMNGAQALIYARSRHGSTDFDRASRQQKILVALKDEADLQTIGANLEPLVAALQATIHTDLPEDPDFLGSLLDLAGRTGTSHIAQYVFAPPIYATEHNDPQLYWIEPDVNKIRQGVQDALNGVPGPLSEPSAQPSGSGASSGPTASITRPAASFVGPAMLLLVRRRRPSRRRGRT